MGAAVCVGLVTAAALALPAQSAQSAQSSPNRGALVDITGVGTASRQNIVDDLTAYGFRFDQSQVRNSVHAFRLTYRTVDAHGRATTASGLFVLPDTNKRDIATITYLHGTMSGRDEAPSVEARSNDRYASYLYSSAGYATVAPDYVGLGTGPGTHPYLDVANATAASVDLLEAARTAAYRLGRSLGPDVYVNGFSQGAVVAMDLGNALQAGAVPGLRAAAIAPISGPYALQDAEIPAALSTDPARLDQADATFYLAYFLVAWQRVYHIYQEPSAVFQAPYDRTVPPLFNGDNDEDAIFSKLPSTPEQLVTPAFLAELAHPGGRLLAALRANDDTCSNWRPMMPIRFFYADGDEQVAAADTTQCRADLAAHGVATTAVDVGTVGHSESAHRSVAEVLSWFESTEFE